jgi:D-glycero-alpha-D-manno-heptose 1-phosphate guanylyltransferase
MTQPQQYRSILLAGGRGTRLAHIHSDLPKPWIPVNGRPFIETVLMQFARWGLDSFTLSVGHLADVVETWLETSTTIPPDLEISLIVEDAPLGTGGAIADSWRRTAEGQPIVAANADCLLVTDLAPAFAAMDDETIDGVVVGRRVEDAARFGTLDIDDNGLLAGFREKIPGEGIINAGIYLLKPHLLADFALVTPLSVEHEVFPEMISAGRRLAAVTVDGPFLDIGTPDTLAQAESFVQEHLHNEARS